MADPHHSQASNLSNVLVERGCLSEREVELLMEAARQHRWGHRDATAILVAYQHGLRASELVALRWDDIDLTTGRMRIRRGKGDAAKARRVLGWRHRVRFEDLVREMVDEDCRALGLPR